MKLNNNNNKWTWPVAANRNMNATTTKKKQQHIKKLFDIPVESFNICLTMIYWMCHMLCNDACRLINWMKCIDIGGNEKGFTQHSIKAIENVTTFWNYRNVNTLCWIFQIKKKVKKWKQTEKLIWNYCQQSIDPIYIWAECGKLSGTNSMSWKWLKTIENDSIDIEHWPAAWLFNRSVYKCTWNNCID